jgi:dephospho-CoA kinase
MSSTRKIIGITGGIATGKTAVLKILKQRGLPVISSDELAHAALRNRAIRQRVVRHFGTADRQALGRIVFARPAERQWLERQIHPWVIRGLKSFIRKHRGLIALDIPLLFEARLDNLVDAVVVVSASQASQLSRLQRRNQLDRAAALKRIRAQWPLSRKIKRADYVLANSGSLASLRKRVGALLVQLKEAS